MNDDSFDDIDMNVPIMQDIESSGPEKNKKKV